MQYDGIPVEVSDFQPDTETEGSETAASSVYGIQFSEADGIVGLTNGGVEVVDIGQLESKDAVRTRIRWYVSVALLRDSALARLRGVDAA